MRRALLALGLILAAIDGPARAERIALDGDGVTLRAEMVRPDGSGPFPAVVALHGCGGLYRKDGSIAERDADWAKRLQAAGILVLQPDSFGSRGEGSQCRVREREILTYRERASDAFAALAYLQSRTDVKTNEIALLGWSNGGLTVLHVLRQAVARGGENGFAQAVAFYPPCRYVLERGNWQTRTPLLILIGEADDWTPPGPCRDLVSDAKADGEPVSIVTYPGAYHDFDHPNLPVRQLNGLSATPDDRGTAHIGTNPAARDDALARVLAFLGVK